MRLISFFTVVTAFILSMQSAPTFAQTCTAEEFNEYDGDGDGTWSPEEYARWAEINQFTPRNFAVVDANGDGQVSFEEWLVIYCSA